MSSHLLRRQAVAIIGLLTLLSLVVLSLNRPAVAGPTDDSDSDGIQNQFEDANLDADNDETTSPGPDSDGNGTPDYLDPDDDGDGIPTAAESSDPNGDGDPRDALDSDFDGQADYLDPATIGADPQVASEVKIGNGLGGLGATLDNDDTFGFDTTSIGDLDGDGTIDLAVGAIWDGDGGPDRGAVYVLFMNPDGTVRAGQKISDLEGGFAAALDDRDEFGTSVAAVGDLDGDGTTELAVGARGDDDGGIDRGAVYILFMNTDGTVRSERKISATVGGLAGPNLVWFGQRSAEIGDLDGDGIPDLAVGASSSHEVRILFLNADGTVRTEQRIGTSLGGLAANVTGSWFGIDITSLGDLDGDGVADIAVGAFGDNAGGGDAGAVHILFLNSDGTVNAEQKISATEGGLSPGPGPGDNFGSSVAALGDVYGDGSLVLAVGAAFAEAGGAARGEVYLLSLGANGMVQSTDKIGGTSGGFTGPPGDYFEFGSAVASVGDLDGDGTIGLAVGAYGDDDGGGFYQGAVYVFDLKPSTIATVNSTGDAGDALPGDGRCDTGGTNSQGEPACTLRAAIEEANASALVDTVEFHMPTSEAGHAAGLWTLTPTSPFPTITAGVTIDGSTQPGHVENTIPAPGGLDTTHAVVLDGAGAGGPPFTVDADGTMLHGLVIHGFNAPLYVQSTATITGSIIGADATGTVAVPGGNNVIHHRADALLQLGGTAAADRNLISGHGSAIYLNGDGAIVEGNLIGTEVTGTTPLGSQTRNLVVRASNVRVGGTTPTSGNVISGPGPGVSVDGGTGNSILGNTIFNNGDVGIDLSPINAPDGPTLNDAGDVDSGTNDYLNHPEIVDARFLAGTVTVDFDLDVPAGTYRVEAFTNPSGADPSGYGEGERFAAATTVTHLGGGRESFTLTFAGALGDIVSLTTTQDLGGGAFGSTSEFSVNAVVGDGRVATVNSTGDASDALLGDAVCDTGATNAQGDPECTLRAAIEEAAASPGTWTINFDIPANDPNHVYHRDDGIADTLSAPVATTLTDDSILDFDPDYPVNQFSWWTIQVSGNLPDVPGNTTIDGTTQPGWEPNTATGGDARDAILPIVVTSDGFYIMNLDGSGSTLRGVNLSSATGTMLYVNGTGDHVVEGSWFMVDPLGIDNGTGDDGIWVVTLTTDNRIGGPDPEDHLLIGNGFSNSGLTVISDMSTVQNVWIGSKVTGDELLPGYNDIPFYISGNDNVIGSPGAGVVVSSSLNEILILEGDRNTVQASSFGYLPNGTPAVEAASTVDGDDNLIGGVNAGEGNRFHGGEFGFVLSVNGGVGNSVLGSSYTGTTGLNLDVGPPGHNVNDVNDTDIGDNDLLNHPTLTSVIPGAGTTTATFDLDVPAGDYRIEIHADMNEAPNPTGYGAGEAIVASTSITHTGSGVETFQAVFPTVGTAWFGATATEDLGAGDFGSTSEFGSALYVADPRAVVNSTGDAGDAAVGDGRCDTGATNSEGTPECTYRAAIEEANASALNQVSFSMPATEPGHSGGVWTISPTSALPQITQPITIDGTTQPGYAANTAPAPLPVDNLPVVELAGADDGDGIHLAAGADGSVLRGLTINGFNGVGLYGIEVNADDVTITGMLIGLEADGVTDDFNAYGVVINADRTVVGGAAPEDRNVISGSQNAQVLVETTGNGIQILGNILGADASTTLVPGAWGSGIQVWNGDDITIGSAAAPNVIASSAFEFGIETGASNVVIDSNIIGTDATYTFDLSSGYEAIGIFGSTGSVTNNVIGHYSYGIRVDEADHTITGNFIGTDPSGTIDLGLAIDGIHVTSGASGVVIGGVGPADANLIAFNGGNGITLRNPSVDPAILGNRIVGNGGLSIDHGDDGVTPNDSPDADGVPNFPVLSQAETEGADVLVTFELDTTPGDHRIEFFLNPSGADPSGHGEAESLIHTIVVQHAGGSASYTTSFAGRAGEPLAATTTRLAGGPGHERTSEVGPTTIVTCGDIDGDGLSDCAEDENLDGDADPTTNPGPDTDGDSVPDYLDPTDDPPPPVDPPLPPVDPPAPPIETTTTTTEAPSVAAPVVVPTTTTAAPQPVEADPQPAAPTSTNAPTTTVADPPVALPLIQPEPPPIDPVEAIAASESALRELSGGTQLDLSDETEQVSLGSFFAPILTIGHLRLPLHWLLPMLAVGALLAQVLAMSHRGRQIVRVAGVSRHAALNSQGRREKHDPVRLSPYAATLRARRGWRRSHRGAVELTTPVGPAIVPADNVSPM